MASSTMDAFEDEFRLSEFNDASTMDADQDVGRWSELNDELFSLIVSEFPPDEIFRLRFVCKTWNTFLRNHFSPLFGLAPAQAISFYSEYQQSKLRGFAAYNFGMRTWHRWTSVVDSRYFSRYKVYEQVGDWLLVEHKPIKEDEEDDELCQSLCLLNPTKKFKRRLPRLPEGSKKGNCFQSFPVQLITGESSESCKVLIMSTEERYREPSGGGCSSGERSGQGRLDASYVEPRTFHRGFLYDSMLDSWKAIGPWEERREDKGDDIMITSSGSLIFHDGALHCILSEYLVWWEYDLVSRQIARYDEQESCWQELSAQMPKGEIYKLFEWHGHLMLTGGRYVTQGREARLASVHIWQMDAKNHIWVESMKMPNHLVDYFYLPEILDQDVQMGSHRIVPVTSSTICGQYIWWTNKYIFSDQPNYKHVVFDLSKNVWWDVPEPGPGLWPELKPEEEEGLEEKQVEEQELERESQRKRESQSYFQRKKKKKTEEEQVEEREPEPSFSYGCLGFSLFKPKFEV